MQFSYFHNEFNIQFDLTSRVCARACARMCVCVCVCVFKRLLRSYAISTVIYILLKYIYFHSTHMPSQTAWLFKPAYVVFHLIDISPLYTQHTYHMLCSNKHDSLTEFQPQVGWKEEGHPKMIIQHAWMKGTFWSLVPSIGQGGRNLLGGVLFATLIGNRSLTVLVQPLSSNTGFEEHWSVTIVVCTVS